MRRWKWLLMVVGFVAAGAARADEALWRRLQGGGQVVLVRHALTDPGVGDPAGMKLEDCATQRNLNEEGRREARALGEALRTRGIPIAGVQSSPWCRCLETARLAFARPAALQPALGNLFDRPEQREPQVAVLKQVAQRVPTGGNLFLVTHGSTTLALTGVSPATAEMVILTPLGNGFRVAGRLAVR